MDLNGRVRSIVGKDGFCNIRFQGQVYDDDIQLCYNRFRWYDDVDGRYISKDPIGLLSGEYGFYNYVGDSNGWVDVFGLSKSAGYRRVKKYEDDFGSNIVHSLDKHGAHTTLRQQWKRANKGILPNGKKSYKTNATRFLSHKDHMEAISKAEIELLKGGGNVKTTKHGGYNVKFDMPKEAAEGYKRGSSIHEKTKSVTATFTGDMKLVSIFGQL
ncbi:RHS repeat domain-containing protein [Tenacibaculum maritimum]|uniref:RHS repeat domain-containing protein n=1 Tax=Tenacibaculum maritimum TaxID=107401 RepID=UPI001330E215|nr:RHS repeat-associated core domain-containing protein [Tenacibaculum maritimum]